MTDVDLLTREIAEVKAALVVKMQAIPDGASVVFISLPEGMSDNDARLVTNGMSKSLAEHDRKRLYVFTKVSAISRR